MKAYKVPRTDLVVSRIAYGCHQLVDITERFKELIPTGDYVAMAKEMRVFGNEPLGKDTIAKAVRLINVAYDNGITLFDHADIYGAGKCEEAFGEVLKHSPGLRDKIVIQSKCGIRLLADPRPSDPVRFDCSGEHIVNSVEGSLRRLRTDYLDIFLLHQPDALVEPEEVAKAFEGLHRSGKVRHFGVSNHTAAQIERLKKCVCQPLVANQIQLSLEHASLIADGMEANRNECARITHSYTGVAGTLDYCFLHDILVQTYSPLRGSLLNPPVNSTPQVKQAAQALVDVAQKKNTTPSAVALAWLLRHPAGIVPIIGTTNAEHIVENCAADRVMLSREEWYTLFESAAGIGSLGLLGATPEKVS